MDYCAVLLLQISGLYFAKTWCGLNFPKTYVVGIKIKWINFLLLNNYTQMYKHFQPKLHVQCMSSCISKSEIGKKKINKRCLYRFKKIFWAVEGVWCLGLYSYSVLRRETEVTFLNIALLWLQNTFISCSGMN